MTQKFKFIEGNHNVHRLEASYSLLTKTLGDGTVAPRDTEKSMAQWDIYTDLGSVEIYDYKVGICYQGDVDGLPLEQITLWHVQGDLQAIEVILADLEENIYPA